MDNMERLKAKFHKLTEEADALPAEHVDAEAIGSG